MKEPGVSRIIYFYTSEMEVNKVIGNFAGMVWIKQWASFKFKFLNSAFWNRMKDKCQKRCKYGCTVVKQ